MNYEIESLKGKLLNSNINLEKGEVPNEEKNVETETVELTTSGYKKYKDVSDAQTEAVNYATERGYLTEYKEDTFDPDGKITKAQMAQVLYSMAGKPEVSGTSKFSDVTNTAWYSKAIIWATEKGLISGDDSGKYNPGANITNEEALGILRNYAGSKSFDTNGYITLGEYYQDAGSISGTTMDTYTWAVDNKIYQGSTLNPSGEVTRGSLAGMLMGFDNAYSAELGLEPISASFTNIPNINDVDNTTSTTSTTTSVINKEDTVQGNTSTEEYVIGNETEDTGGTTVVGGERTEVNTVVEEEEKTQTEKQETGEVNNTTVIENEENIIDGNVIINEETGKKELKQSREYSDVALEDMPVVNYVSEKGYMVGMSDTTFNPNVKLTRAQMVQALYSASGKPKVNGSSNFTDVKSDDWYYDAVTWAKQSGLVAGYDNGAFGANDVLTNEQMIAIMRKYAEYNGYDVSASGDISGYVDAGNVSNYATDSMSWAVDNNLYGGGTLNLNPKNAVTRIEFARLLTNFDNHYDRTELFSDNATTNDTVTNENGETITLNPNTDRVKDPLKTYDTRIPYKSTQAEREAYVRNVGYMVGDDTGFNPNGQVTRAQMVQVLYAMEGKPDKGNATFRDVKSDQWYADAVSWAKTNGIVGGFEDGTFRPDEPITNEQMMTIMKAYATYKGTYDGASLSSISSIKANVDSHDYATESLAWAYENKLFNDSKVNSVYDIKAKNIASRDDMAGLLMGYDRAFNEEKYLNVPKKILTKEEEIQEGIYRINSISERFDAYDYVYKEDYYGGNQAEPRDLLLRYTSEEELYQDNSIKGQKAQIINETIKKYYPNTDFKQRINIAKKYNNCGCNYTAVAQSMLLTLSNEPNAEEIFRKLYGFDMYVTDGVDKEPNTTAVAMDMFLDRYKNLSYDKFLGECDGTNYEFDHYQNYFNSKGIKYEYNIMAMGDMNKQTSYSESSLNNMLQMAYTYSNKHPNCVYALSGKDYDLNIMKANNYVDINTYEEMQNNLRGTNNVDKVEAHSIPVTGYVNDNFIISSWGKQYALPIQQSFQNDVVKTSEGNNYYPNLRLVAINFDYSKIGGTR